MICDDSFDASIEKARRERQAVIRELRLKSARVELAGLSGLNPFRQKLREAELRFESDFGESA